MTGSDSLDKITLDSDDMRTIERFENNYYNRKNNVLQNGGSAKLEKNIERLFNCYVLSVNQNGGEDNEMSSQIKQRLYNKTAELIVHKNYSKDLQGGYLIQFDVDSLITPLVQRYIETELVPKIPEIIKGINIRQLINDKIAQGMSNTANTVKQGVIDAGSVVANTATGAYSGIATSATGAYTGFANFAANFGSRLIPKKQIT
jgi:hypothetical protein